MTSRSWLPRLAHSRSQSYGVVIGNTPLLDIDSQDSDHQVNLLTQRERHPDTQHVGCTGV
jgi:hypothetical protein